MGMKTTNCTHAQRLTQARNASLAPATQRTYACAWKSWVGYAKKRNQVPIPAEVKVLESWLVHLSCCGRSPATIGVYRSAVAWHHRCYSPNPVLHPEVCDTVAGLVRLTAQENYAPRQASPLRRCDIAKIAVAIREPRNNKPGGRRETSQQAQARGDIDIAMIYLAYDAALRASELLTVKWSDIEPSQDGLGGRVRIRRSKTDQTAQGEVLPISAQTLAALENIRPASAQPEDRIFTFSYATLNRRIKVAAQTVGIDAVHITSHSLRIGLAQDLAAEGATMPTLMLAGRWTKPETVFRYIKHIAADQTPLAQYHRKHSQTKTNTKNKLKLTKKLSKLKILFKPQPNRNTYKENN